MPNRALWLSILVAGAACSDSAANSDPGVALDAGSSPVDARPSGDAQPGPGADAAAEAAPKALGSIFVIPLENKPSAQIYGNTTDAPYLNTLLATGAHATKFADELPRLDSEPHYVWMEAGTNVFSDVSFTTDDPPTASHSTASKAHLATQLETAGISWMSYQEDIKAGTCPIAATGFYAPKHDPFVFFQDVVGSPPSAANPFCIAHHKPYSALADDLRTGNMARFVFVTPNLCHDMHGGATCPQGTADPPNIKAGDAWLKQELPAILAYATAHESVVFLTWDEGDASNLIPFYALGAHVKAGATSTVAYSHSSLLKSIERMLGVPVLPTVAAANDLGALFDGGQLPVLR